MEKGISRRDLLLTGTAAGAAAALSALGQERGTAAAPPRGYTTGPEAPGPTIYHVAGDAIARHNGPWYNNRPLYCHETYSYVFVGDRPLVHLAGRVYVLGATTIGYARGRTAKWMDHFADITAEFRAGRVLWRATDPDFPGVTLTVEAAPVEKGVGFALRAAFEGARKDDRLLWMHGGIYHDGGVARSWDPTMNAKTLARRFDADTCRNNRVTLSGRGAFAAAAGHHQQRRGHEHAVAGICDASHPLLVVDAASALRHPGRLTAKAHAATPAVAASIPLSHATGAYHFVVYAAAGEEAARKAARRLRSARQGFQRAIAAAEKIGRQVSVRTPEPRLDVGVAMSCAAVDGIWRPPVCTHAAMTWAVALLGWRSMFGTLVYGWHDRIAAEAAHYIPTQVRHSNYDTPRADPKSSLTRQAPDSRFMGVGRVRAAQSLYDMQSMFFDQLAHNWRWTGNAAFGRMLRPALELHLEYIKACFEREGHIYESYINSWPTDSQWYNGGGTAEETAYAYYARLVARDMALQAGDHAEADRHTAEAAKIKEGFLKLLWMPDKGYVGAYREQIGLKRVHEDCWMYSIFLPIDCGLLDQLQAASALYYTEWGLQRDTMRGGGQHVWTSNWVPSTWSLRQLWPGDCFALALAYYQAGLADNGWNVLAGTFIHSQFDKPAPGGLSCYVGATDFADISSMFCRAVVEGLFGFKPDYPNGTVHIAPQFPSHWDHADITTPDVSLSFKRTNTAITLTVKLRRPARLIVDLPVCAGQIAAATCDAQPAAVHTRPGFGNTIARVEAAKAREAEFRLTLAHPLPQAAATALTGEIGEPIVLHAPGAAIVSVRDPQACLTGLKVHGDAAHATLTGAPGYKMVFAEVRTGSLLQWRQYKIHARNTDAAKAEAAAVVQRVPRRATWHGIEMAGVLNGDVRQIYQQKYLHPRPNTCSVRLAENGYSTWLMSLGKGPSSPPIDLVHLDRLRHGRGRIKTPQKAEFLFPSSGHNIAFASQWTNWPSHVEVPVNRGGEAIWFLVCGATNPMQGKIANAVIDIVYADGHSDKLELIPPFNFWTLCKFGTADYNYRRDGFCLPRTPPPQVQLGNNCRAMVLNRRLPPGHPVKLVRLEVLSQEAIIGLMAVSIMNA